MYHIKKDRRAMESSALLYKALRDLMQEKAYHTITVSELAKRAGVGRATFYRAFDCIDDVLLMECERRFGELTELMRREQRQNTRVGLRSMYSHQVLGFWYEDSEIIDLILKAHRFEFLLGAFTRMIEELFAGKLRENNMPERFDEYILSMQTGAAIGLLLRWIQNGKDIPSEEMAGLLDETVIRLEEVYMKNNKNTATTR